MKSEKLAKHIVLLQIAGGHLAWLEAKETEGSLLLIGGGMEPLAAGGEEVSSAKDLRQAIHAVSNQLHVGWLEKPEVILIAPTHLLTARFMETPPADIQDIGELAAFEVSEALQVPIEEIAWDRLISSAHGDAMEKHLLWVAARKDFIDSLMEEWASSDLAPTQVTPDFWGLYEFLLSLDEESLKTPTVIVSQEGGRATITVANRRAVYAARSVTLTRPSLSGGEADSEVQKERLLAGEIERTMAFASDRFPKGSIKSMILCGFPDWELNQLREMTERNGIVLNHLVLKDVMAYFQRKGGELTPLHLPLLCIAYCRLHKAIKGINLLSAEAEAISWRALFHEAAAPSRSFLAAAGCLAAFLIVLWAGGSIWYKGARAARLDKGADMIKVAERLLREETVLKEMMRSDFDFGNLFIFLSEALPQGVMVSSISVDLKTGIELALAGVNHQRIIEIIEKLNSGSLIKDMELDRSVNESGQFVIYLKGKLK
ncbi:MAG: hypothetical protein AB1656_15255 [Candidatus Omnitrophota bacterium]